MVLNAAMISDEYEEPENQILANTRLTGGLYESIETLAWFISVTLVDVKAGLERIKTVDDL